MDMREYKKVNVDIFMYEQPYPRSTRGGKVCALRVDSATSTRGANDPTSIETIQILIAKHNNDRTKYVMENLIQKAVK